MTIVAIAGGTGHVGQYITSALLSSVPKPTVRVLTRSESSDKLAEFVHQGAELRIVDYNSESSVVDAIRGADVFISALGGRGAGKEAKGELMKTVLGVDSIKLVVPSEFGMDHRNNDVSHKEWDTKQGIQKLLTSQTRVKVAFIYTGLFMEDSFGPWFGLGTKERIFEIIGEEKPVSFTSMADVGRATAAVVLKSPLDLPQQLHLRLAGDTVTIREAASIFGSVSGNQISVVCKDRSKFEAERQREQRALDTADYLRIFMGNGTLNHSLECGNEFVNPHEQMWKWKTVKGYAAEVKGRPWEDL